MKPVVVIIGPTASGKTGVSIELAKRINGEIISADSMQVYKHMDIGTAKPSKEEMEGIRHFMLDEIEPTEQFSAAQYKTLALNYIETIYNNGKTPILCGGTGLYVNSVIYNIEYSETVSDWEFRKKLSDLAIEKGNKFIHDELKKIDPIAAAKIHENNLKRVIRALEVYHLSTTTISAQQALSREIPSKYEFIVFVLNPERKKLYDKISERVDRMFESGLVEEVEGLKKTGLDKNSLSMQGIGYKEILDYLSKEITLNEAIELVKKRTRNYAKRQMTWFRKIEGIRWIDIDYTENKSEIAEKIINEIDKL